MVAKSKKIKQSLIFGSNSSYSAVTSSGNEVEIKSKKSERNSNNLPFSAYTARIWCHYFAQNYKDVYGKIYPNYPSKLKSEAITLSNVVYPIVFDELKFSAREFADFLRVYLQTSKNDGRELVVMMLKTDASKSKFNYYIKKYRRKRKNDLFESLIYIPHKPITNDPDDLDLILNSSNLNSIQMLANFGIPIYHKFLMKSVPMSFEDAAKSIRNNIFNDILLKYRSDNELVKKLFEIIVMNSILWEPLGDSGHVSGLKTSVYYHLDWRKEFKDVLDVYDFKKKNWWKEERFTNQLATIPSVKRYLK